MISVTVKTGAMKAALAQYGEQLSGASADAMLAAMEAARATAVDRIQERTQRRTGKLQDDWRKQVLARPFAARLFNPAPYGRWVDEGTRPHDILPKRRKFLRFEVGGMVVFARRVRHPGTKPRPFLAPAAAVGEVVLVADLQARADGLAHAFGR